MNKTIVAIGLAFLLIQSSAWGQVPLGEYHPNGALKIEWQAGGEGVLLRKEFYPDGMLKSEAIYRNGQIDGIYREYGPAGNPLIEMGYLNGVEHGAFREFSANGSVSKEGLYENGNLSGPQKIFDENGVLYQVIDYKRGRKHGSARVFFPGGGLKEESPYLEGALTGTARFYNSDGSLRAESRYLAGRRQGEAVEYYPNGLLKAQMNFVDDEIEGEFIEYYENQGIQKKIVVTGGEIVERKVYDEMGNLDEGQSFPKSAPVDAGTQGTPPVSPSMPSQQTGGHAWGTFLKSPAMTVGAIAYLAVLIIGIFIGRILKSNQEQEGLYQRHILSLTQETPQLDSEKVFRDALATDRRGIFMANANGRLFYANQTFAQMFGRGDAKILTGVNINTLFKDIVNQENQLLKQLGESVEIHDFRFRYRLPNSDIAVLSVYANRAFDDLGRPAGVQGVVSKITEIKQSEAAFELAGSIGPDEK